MIMGRVREPFGAQEFDIGQIVAHKRYAYRGVIVASDASCQADEQWYQNNQSQPSRDQPWYSILVDQATHHTYVAESNLALCQLNQPIMHPLMGYFFNGYGEGVYVRNQKPWP